MRVVSTAKLGPSLVVTAVVVRSASTLSTSTNASSLVPMRGWKLKASWALRVLMSGSRSGVDGHEQDPPPFKTK